MRRAARALARLSGSTSPSGTPVLVRNQPRPEATASLTIGRSWPLTIRARSGLVAAPGVSRGVLTYELLAALIAAAAGLAARQPHALPRWIRRPSPKLPA